MASAIACDFCQAEQALLMQSNTQTGETMAVGGQCLLSYFAGAAKAIAEQSGHPTFRLLDQVCAVLNGSTDASGYEGDADHDGPDDEDGEDGEDGQDGEDDPGMTLTPADVAERLAEFTNGAV